MLSLTLDNEPAIYQYLCSFLKKTEAKQLASTISHFVKHHGKEWTVSYLKDMKTKLVSSSSANRLGVVAKAPKGSFKPVWRLQLKEGLQVLNIYTCEKSEVITKRQAIKFVDAVRSKPIEVARLHTDPIILKAGQSVFRGMRWRHPYQWIRSSKKRTPFIDNHLNIKSVDESSLTFQDVLTQLSRQDEFSKDLVREFGHLYARSMWVPFRTIMGALEGLSRDIFDHSKTIWYTALTARPVVGSLGFIQEKGFKLRVVANAFRHHQMALTALGDVVYRLLERLPWDCTFDQQKGHRYIQNSLSQGKTVFCYDLSNATDRFPLSIQLDVMSDVIEQIESRESESTEKDEVDEADVTIKDLKESLRLFSRLARGLWYAPLLGRHMSNDYIRWTKGQPLGLYPSFGIFALAHGNMVRAIERRLGLAGTFMVLGDDIIITHHEVAETYRQMMEGYGCEISVSKSVISSVMGEFAGKILTADSDVTPLKWSNFDVKSPFRPVEILGVNGLRFIPGKFRKGVKSFVALPEPVGLGQNPDGLSLDVRLDNDTLKWYWPRRYDLVNSRSLSYDDRKERHEMVLNALYSPKSVPDLWRCISPPLDQSDESSVGSSYLKREHYNAIVRGLDPWEGLPEKVEVPVIDIVPSRGNIMKKGSESSVLTRIFQYLRNLKRARTVD